MSQKSLVTMMIRDDLKIRLEKLAKSRNIDLNTLLEESLNQYEYHNTIMGITSDAVISANANYQITAFNQGAENIFGYKSEEVLGQSLNMLIPEHLHDTHQQHMQDFVTGNESIRLMSQRSAIYCQHKDARVFPAEAAISKSDTEQGIQFHIVLRDISHHIEIRQQLEISEHYLQLVMDNVTDLVCLHKLDGRYKFVSQSSYHLTGYQPNELIGQSPDDYLHPDDVITMKKIYKIVTDGETVDGALYRFRHKDGHYIWCETKIHAVMDANNNITHLVAGTRDATEQVRVHQELQDERDLLAKIMNTSPFGINVVDKSGNIEFANKRSEEILRLSKSDRLGHVYDLSEWKHAHLDGLAWTDEDQPFIRVMKTRKPIYDVRYALESPDGQRVLLSTNGAPIFDENGEISKVVFTLEDITELRRAEQSLRESLAQERDINTIKSQFLSIVSHEFRTPLSVILTSVDIIQLLAKDKLTSKELHRLDQIRKQVKYLDVQLDEVSAINQSDQINQELKLEQTFVVDLMYQLILETQTRYQDCPPIKVVTPHTKMDSCLLDPQLIQHILSNLIGNAVKYSDGQGEITITLSFTGQTFYFSVKDRGIGIRQEDQDNLFDFFFRGDNVGGVKGTGIGLAVVKQSVEAHGGEIDFVSRVGIGTTFTVTIPFNYT